MKKYGIFYGSTTGTTEEVALMIAKTLNINNEDVYNVADTAPSKVADYETIILGASTWGSGELQDNMDDFITGLSAMALEGKKIALFGCGDESMTDTFCDGIDAMYERLKDTGATFIGSFEVDDYHFDHSRSVKDGMGIGLLIDQVNHPETTEERIKAWASTLE